MIKTRLHKYQQGLTIIELMVAMVIGLLLLMGTVTMFMSNRESYQFQEQMGRLQENARFAMDLLVSDIRMAGYYGCSHDIYQTTNHLDLDDEDDPTLLQTTVRNANLDLVADYSLEGLEDAGDWVPSGTATPADIVAGSDGVSMRLVNLTNFVPIIYDSDEPPSTSVLNVAANNGLAQDEIVTVTDCKSADIFQITNNPSADETVEHAIPGLADPGNKAVTTTAGSVVPGETASPYGPNAAIYRFITRRYYVADIGNGASLFMVGNDNVPVELVDGVESMQILYGVDTTGAAANPCRECPNYSPVQYMNADAIATDQWSRVVSVRIGLLMRTADESFSDEVDIKTYDLLGTVLGPYNDKRKRRMFTTTVMLRNRIF